MQQKEREILGWYRMSQKHTFSITISGTKGFFLGTPKKLLFIEIRRNMHNNFNLSNVQPCLPK